MTLRPAGEQVGTTRWISKPASARRRRNWGSVRSRARRVDAAEQELTATLGRAPTHPELAEVLGHKRLNKYLLEQERMRFLVALLKEAE